MESKRVVDTFGKTYNTFYSSLSSTNILQNNFVFICPFCRIKRIWPIGLKKKRSSCRKRKWKGEDVGITTLFIAAAVHRGE